jgi:hypothetical protein
MGRIKMKMEHERYSATLSTGRVSLREKLRRQKPGRGKEHETGPEEQSLLENKRALKRNTEKVYYRCSTHPLVLEVREERVARERGPHGHSGEGVREHLRQGPAVQNVNMNIEIDKKRVPA